jgi:hypothetical protein
MIAEIEDFLSNFRLIAEPRGHITLHDVERAPAPIVIENWHRARNFEREVSAVMCCACIELLAVILAAKSIATALAEYESELARLETQELRLVKVVVEKNT